MEGKIPCSVPILTLNVRPHLERLLPVLKEACEDVFIVDGNSTDGTRELAQSMGIRIEQQTDSNEPNLRITDFTMARLRSWSFARFPWVFLVDADEVPTPELITRVRSIVEAGDMHAAHRFRRLAQLPDGTVIQRAFFYPEETMLRLFHHNSGITLTPDRKVHERFHVPLGVQAMTHPEAFIHAWPDVAHFQQKLAHYSALEYADAPHTVSHRIRWVVWYNLRSALGQLVRAMGAWVHGRLQGQTVLPWSYTWPMITYRFRVLRQGLKQPTP